MKERNLLLLLVLLAVTTFFVNNSALPTDIMEARNLVTAREIVADGNWMVPTMNGELRLEKPPLPTWVAAAIESVAPDNLTAQRLAPGIMGVVWTVYLVLLTAKVSRRRKLGYTAGIVFLTCYQTVLMGRTATWDIYCHAFMTAAIYYLYCGLSADKSHQWRYLPMAGVMMGLSFLSKGPVSFYALLLPWLLAAVATLRLSARGKWKALTCMIVLCLALAAAWYIYLYAFEPKAVQQVIDKETGSWAHRNVRPWWYYWRYFAEMGIWALLTLAALALRYWKRVLPEWRTYMMAALWVIACVVLLSFMPEKKYRYLLPVMAPCAIAVACLVYHMHEANDRASLVLWQVHRWLIAVVVVAMAVAVWVMQLLPVWQAVMLTVLCLALAVDVARPLRGDSRSWRLLLGAAGAFMLIECFLMGSIAKAMGNPGSHSIAATRYMPQLHGLPFYFPQGDSLRIEIVYQAHRKILPLNMADSANVVSHSPMVLVSSRWNSAVLSPAILSRVDTVMVGTYDDNTRPRGSRHYQQCFVNHVTIIKPKK